MRLGVILSSQFVADDLVAEFGRIVPSQLPLANKPLCDYQKTALGGMCDEIICTLPQGHDSSWTQVNKLHLEQGLSLRDAIEEVLTSTPHVSEYVFYFGDTLLDFEFAKNTFFLGVPQFDYPSWYYTSSKEVFAGVFVVERGLLSSVLSTATNTLALLQGLDNELDHLLVEGWFDFGNYTTYYNSKKRFLETREFNTISVSEGAMLTKMSHDIGKMYFEYNWLDYYSAKHPVHCPTPKNFKICGPKASYDLEYFPLPTLSDLYVFGLRDAEFWNNVLLRCQTVLAKLQEGEVREKNDDEFYFEKVVERTNSFDYHSLGFSSSEIGDQLNLAKALDNFDDEVGGAHGDFCFSNLLWDNRTSTVKLIDPRGYMSRNLGQSILMPLRYDAFKLAHSFIGGYDWVIVKNRSYQASDKALEFFLKTFGIERKWLVAGMSHLFFTMIPLHADREDRQLKFVELAKKYHADYTSCR